MSDCCKSVIGDHCNEDEIAQVCHGHQGMIITTLLSDLIYCAYSYLEYSDKRWFQRIKTLDWGSFVQLQAIYSSSSAINNTCPWPSTEIIAVWWPKVFANALLSSPRDKKELLSFKTQFCYSLLMIYCLIYNFIEATVQPPNPPLGLGIGNKRIQPVCWILKGMSANIVGIFCDTENL